MNKIVRKITALISAGLISASLVCSISSSAYIDIYTCDFWEKSTQYPSNTNVPRCQRKSSDSSIYVYNNSWDVGNGAYVSIYGNNSNNRYDKKSVSSCSQYWGSLTMTNLYFESRTAYLVRNYVNEKQFKYAVIDIVPRGKTAYGCWKADLYGDETYGFWNAN